MTMLRVLALAWHAAFLAAPASALRFNKDMAASHAEPIPGMAGSHAEPTPQEALRFHKEPAGRAEPIPTTAASLAEPTPEEARAPARLPKSRRAEYQVPSRMPADAEIVARGRRWSPGGWIHNRSGDRRAYFDIHIPKTAGCSFAIDVQKVLASGEGFYSNELCYHDEKPGMRPALDAQVAFVRNPTAHVYSMFLECKYDVWGDWIVRKTIGHGLGNVTSWLAHFEGGKNRSDYGCYHPYNMLTRAFTCRSGGCHHHTTEKDPPLAEALRNVNSIFFLGITEHYQASLCLFFAKTQAPSKHLPKWCNCMDKKSWNLFKQTHESHHTPPHSLKNLTQEDLAMISNLTRLDQQLYDAALYRFKGEIAEVERERDTKLLC